MWFRCRPRICSVALGELDHNQYRPQIVYSSFVPRNLKSTSTMSWKPSLSLGSLNLDANPVKAILGSGCRSSGFICRTESARLLQHSVSDPQERTYLLVQRPDHIIMFAQLNRR